MDAHITDIRVINKELVLNNRITYSKFVLFILCALKRPMNIENNSIIMSKRSFFVIPLARSTINTSIAENG